MADKFICIKWYVSDVLQTAEDMGLSVSKQEALDILHSIEDDHNPEYGVTWDTLKDYIVNYIDYEREED